MAHDKEYVIRLNGLDLGQLIDGLEARATAWRLTATYLGTGEAPDGFVIEECDDAGEAWRIAEHYKSIIHQLVMQKAVQDAA
ncbi:MAG: hypothetical protein IPK70_12885 [Flavobacteriales bacterium]|jgi:hypothetical protein|nr:hypothetical protein [Flavobacteriales bacterium]